MLLLLIFPVIIKTKEISILTFDPQTCRCDIFGTALRSEGLRPSLYKIGFRIGIGVHLHAHRLAFCEIELKCVF